MSAPTNAAAAKADTKRGRPSKADGSQSSQPVASDRSVRQRIGPTAVQSAPAPSAAAASAAVSSAVVSPARSFMQLAVVERQLIMQGLDIHSLTHLASSCKQLCAEALHPESGKLLPKPRWSTPLGPACYIHIPHSAHASALFRKHMPMTLDFSSPTTGMSLKSLAQIEPLLAKASTFSRIIELMIDTDGPLWTEAWTMQLLTLPCLQAIELGHFVFPGLRLPRVQAYLFTLPRFRSLTMRWLRNDPAERLYKHTISQAHGLTFMDVSVATDNTDSIRAIRWAPSLTELRLMSNTLPHLDPFHGLIWCLPPTLRSLSLELRDASAESMQRPNLKAFFKRTPLLQTLKTLEMETEPLLQGMIDAGLQALPLLRRVEFQSFKGSVSSALLRRFLHRFPEVHIRLALRSPVRWELRAFAEDFARTFGGWPRVEVFPSPTLEPPQPHSSDDDSSEVESVSDPGSDSEDQDD